MTSAIVPRQQHSHSQPHQRLLGGGVGELAREAASEETSSFGALTDMTSSIYGGGATGAALTAQTPTVVVAPSAAAANDSSPSSPRNKSSSSSRPFVAGLGSAGVGEALLPPLSPKKFLARSRRASVVVEDVQGSSNNNSSSSNCNKNATAASPTATNSNSTSTMKKMEWLQSVQFATTSGNWQPLRHILAQTVAAKFQVSEQANVDDKNKSNNNNKTKKKRGSSLWKRLSGAGGGSSHSNSNSSKAAREVSASLLRQDQQGNTPLHAALQGNSKAHKKAPTDVVLVLLQLEPRAAQVPNHRGQYPLHTAILNQHELEMIAEIVEAYPDALSKTVATVTTTTVATTPGSAAVARHATLASSITMMTPLSLAVEQAKAATNLTQAPKTFWMTTLLLNNNNNNNNTNNAAENNYSSNNERREQQAAAAAAAAWQENQVDIWATVHWLLLAAATHPQTSLSVGIHSGGGGGMNGNGNSGGASSSSDSRPMLVDALVYAAPPAVVALLIGASVSLLSYENKATAFAGTSLYTCIARHYPFGILQSLACKCPADVRAVRDETGMGLVAALFISGCFEKSVPLTEEWTLSPDFVAIMLESIEQGELMHHDNVAFLDWWSKIEFLIVFGTGQYHQQQQQQCLQNNQNNNKSFPKQYLLHAALSNPDVPPLVIRLLLALYPDSLTMPAPKWMSLLGGATAASGCTATDTSPTSTPVAITGGGGSSLLPIHLCCRTFEYIPRNYEMQIMNKHETSLEWVVQASPPQTVMSRYNGRSAFHYAIESGKLYHSLQALLQVDKRFLRWRDPVTGLFPCMLAAVYSHKKNALDSHKWSCVARNKYTHSVWRGLSDRQKAAAVYRVAESEDVDRLCTIFQLIRQDPIVLIATRSSSSSSSSGSVVGGASIISMADDQSSAATVTMRDSTGMGKVAAHYISWCYKQERKKGAAHIANVENMFVLREAMRLAPASAGGGFCTSMPRGFETWFNELKFWIQCCCPKTIPTVRSRSDNTDDNDDTSNNVAVQEHRLAIPHDQMDRFLLHMAVLNPDTPPAVVALVLAISRTSASIELPGTTDLPLHIACRVSPYTARIFESSNYSTLHLLAKAYPSATRVMSGGKLPLHIAIDSGKTWNDFKVLVEQEKCALLVRDNETGLYPFQLMATKRPYSQEQWVRFMYMARNRTENSVWKGMQSVSRIQAIRAIQREHELDIVSSIFELLRRDASMIKPSSSSSSSNDAAIEDASSDVHDEMDYKVQVVVPSESEGGSDDDDDDEDDPDDDDDDAVSDMSSCMPSQVDESSRNAGPFQREEQHSALGDASYSESEGSSSDDDDGNASESSSECGSERENKAQTALMRLLSQHNRDDAYDEHEEKDDPFRCDASILSGLDVMSTLSSTVHSMHSTLHSTRHFPDGLRGSDFVSSIHGTLSEGDAESTLNASAGTGLANDSNGSGSYEFAEDSVASTTSSYPTENQSLACSLMPDSPESSESSESSSVVFFRMKRRRPKQHDDGEYVQTVRLSKSVPADNPSVSSASVTSPTGKRQSVPRPLLSESPRTASQSTLKSVGTFAEDSYELSMGDLAQVMDDAASTPKDFEKSKRKENLLASLADSGEFDILMTLGGSDDSIGELTGPHGSAGELMSDKTPVTPSSPSDISTKPDSSLTQPSLHPKFVARPPGEAVNMVWITKEKSDSDSEDYLDYGETSIPDLQKVLNLSKLALAKDFRASMFSGGDSSSDSTSKASDFFETETASPEVAATNQNADEAESVAVSLPASAGIAGVTSTKEEIYKDSNNVDSDKRHGKADYKLPGASCGSSLDPVHVSNCNNGQKLASTSTSFRVQMDVIGATNYGDERLAPSTMNSNIMVREKKAAKTCAEESNQVEKAPIHKDDCELATKHKTLVRGTGKGQVSEPVEVVFFDRATMRWVKRKVENNDESKSDTGELESKSMATPFPPERPRCDGLEAGPPDSVMSHTSSSTTTAISKTPSPPKKDMLFDKKAMRWVARDEVKPEEETLAEPNSQNGLSVQTTMSSAVKQASSPYTPGKPIMDTALTGSPFIELVSRHDIKKRNERLAKATHFAATKPIANPRNSLLCRTPLGCIPESQSGVRNQPLMPTHGHLTCIICQKNKREVLMIPCRHLAICRHCSNEFQSLRDCPLCQEKISDKMFIF